MNVYGIVVAAGRGERFGLPKSEILLGGRPLWQWARDALVDGGLGSVIVVGDVPGGVQGGPRRRDSVERGLTALPADATHALVHDAARPLASAQLARAVIERLALGDAEAVVPILPVRDTIKRTDGGWVTETVARQGLGLAQTPQGVSVEALRSALAGDADDASDDASLIERNGGRVAVVTGEARNLKITFPDDLALAEAMLP